MSNPSEPNRSWLNDYPTSDFRPMAESDLHRNLMCELIQTLEDWYEENPNVYVSGNLLLFYEEGNQEKFVAPDVFVVKGVPNQLRPNYLLWEEGKAPDVVIEVTSKSMQREDQETKMDLYRDTLGVSEYFLFDPYEEWLHPPLQGFRLDRGKYLPISPMVGRLPSEVLNLHLERAETQLRLYDPVEGAWLPTVADKIARYQERTRQAKAELARLKAEKRKRLEELEVEKARLKAEIARLRGDRN